MDKDCNQAFLVVFGIPVVLILIAGWILLGGRDVEGGFTEGLLDGLSTMWLPTIIIFAAGGLVDHFIFGGSLLKCLRKSGKPDKEDK